MDMRYIAIGVFAVALIIFVAVQSNAFATTEQSTTAAPSVNPETQCKSCCGNDCNSCCGGGQCSKAGTGTSSCGC